MNRKIYLIGMMALAMLFASCKKEEKPEEQEAAFSITASTENDGSKTYLEGSKVKWYVGDKIKVFDQSKAETFTCKTVATSGTEANFTSATAIDDLGEYWAFYPYNAVTSRSGNTFTFNMSAEQNYKDAVSFADDIFPMAAHYSSGAKSGVNLQFKNACGILKIHATGNTPVTKIVLTDNNSSNNALSGNFTFNPDNKATAAAGGNGNVMTLTISPAVTLTSTPKDFYMILPPGCLAGAFNLKFYNGTEVVKEINKTSAVTGFAVERSKLKTANVDASQVFSFSVNSSGKKVTFSPGNLYIEGTSAGNGNKNNYVFKFEAEQYDYRIYISETHTGVFNWSNSNSASGNGQFGWPGLHWRFPSESPSAYDQGTEFYDWGEAYIMDAKGTVYPPKTWRTLSLDEWNYLLNGRGEKYRKWVKVNGKNGIIILPDGSNINLNSYSNINYSTWKNLEQQGAAFLVAADAGIELNGGWYTWHENNSCWYWTSTNTSIDQAHHVDSDSPGISANGNSGQGNKMNVRLVKDAN